MDDEYSHPADKECGPHYDNLAYQPELVSRLDRSWPNPKKQSIVSGNTYSNYDDMPADYNNKIISCKKLMIILGIILLLIGIISGIVMAIYFSNRRTETGTETETDETIERIEQKVFVAQIKIDEEFTPALANMSSPEAQERAQQFENTMDTVYKNSALADTYNGTEVTGFSNGSVIVTVSITFVIVVKVKPQTPGSGKTPPTVVPQITINATIILKVLTSNSSKTILKFNSIISIKVVNPITTTTTTTTKIPLQVTSDATSSILLTSPSAPTPIGGFDSSAPTSSLSSTSSVFISLPDSTTAKDTVTGGSTSITSGGSPATPVSGASTATSASGASTATSASGASTVTSASVNFTGTSASGGLTSPTASRDFTATPVFENFTQPPTHTSEDTSSWYSSSSPSTPYSGVSDTTPMVTTSPQVDCGLGMSPCNTNNQCINENWICDRIVDCKDGSDENQKVCNWNDTKPTIEPEFPNGTELNCNFEGPGRRLCNYQTSNGSYIWNIQQGPTQSNSTGPNFDHSYQDENGNYIFTESSYGNFMDNASLMSDFIMTHNNTSSLSFYYHMYGQEMGSLSVYFDIRENGQMKRELQWTKSGDNGNYWMKACLLLPRKTVLRVSFIASHGRLHTSDIALDDIEYSLEHCQKLPCTFEDSMCGEVMSPTVQLPDKYSWHLQRSITMWKMAEALGLMGDHSMGTKFARYLVANSSEGSVNDKTMYRTPDFLNENKASLSFRYFINGKDVDRLTVNIRYNNSLVSKTWYKNMNNSQSWHRGCLPVTGKSGAYAEFVAFHGNGSDGMIAVDDIVLLKSPSCNEIFDCEFGNELFCSFKISGDKYRWKMHHSIKGNFIEATGENIEGLKTMLTSQTLTPGPNDSITLKYFMEGSVSLYLNVIEMNQDGKEIIKTLWTGNSQIKPKALNLSMEINALQINEIMENSQNDRIDWMKVCVPLPSKPLAIQIVSLKRDVVKDSMALKYVSIDNEICKVGLMKTNCSFSEPNMCDYIIDCSINTQYLWQRKTGFESKKLTGPQRDHTTNTTSDHFLQTDASKGRTGDNAQVTFPNIKVSNRSSFRFYYYMYGADTGSLQVYINDKMMWKEQGGKTLFWYMGCVDLPLNTRVNVSFIATRGIGPLGNIAIDDVSISHMPCPPRQIKCSFEDEMMCGYTNLPASQTDNKVMEKDQWFRSNISLKQLSIFKSMFVNDYHLQTRGPARIRSPQMQFSGTNCLQFSYFILIGKGTNITVSAIYKDSAKNEENVFSINNFSWAEWRFGQMNLKSGNVTIEFSVKPYDQKITYTFFAINDVKVIANSCPPMACTNANLWKCTTNDICIPNYKVCDKVEDCADGSDELGCSNSSKDIRLIDGIETGDKGRLEIYVQGSWGTTYGLQWVEMNAHVACRQLGFRGFSQSVRFGKYHYGIGKLWKVNCFGNETKIQDCNLVSIENNVPHTYDVGLICYNTTCETFKKVCPKHDNDNFTYCLYDDQFCDGDLDCPDGFDEKNCSTCQNNEFHCKNRKCIPQSMHCDGNIDCKDASDEINCLSKDVKGYVSVFHEDKMVPFCADTSNTGLFNTICMNTAQGVLDVSLEGKNVSNGVIAIYNKTAKSVFGSYELSKTSSCTQARIQCNKPECGKREAIHYTKQFIQFGTPAIPSEYPWQALLLSDGRFICGATVYTDHWIITAEHCVVEKGVNYEVVVGITRLQNLASAHKYKVKAVVHHPNYIITDGIPYSDISLLLLEEMLNFTDSVQPICLPSKVYTKEDDCYLSGWGRNENLISQINLQEAKVIAVDNEECKKYYKIDISIICFKHNYPNMPSCYGDSGGPLVCRNSYGRFELVGVVSFGYPLCIAPNGTAAGFVNVLAMRGWIVDKTRCKMHCPIDNQCLHEPEICDGVKHCNDSSDEMPPYCNPSLSCKFGSSFKCGYKNVLSNLWYWLSIIQSTPGITAKPATGGDEETDEFMLVSPKATKGKPAQMESPEFSNISCMSFFYIAHSNSSSTKAFLTVKAKLTNSGKSEVIWNSNNSNLTKETVHWKLAMIYLPINTKSIVFEAYFMNSNNGSFISVDDIQALGKNCKQSCPGNLYRCKNSECIKNSYRCNRIEDCSDGSDEQNCNEAEAGICGWDQFRCNDGECIDAYEVCDGVQHCKDGKDETNCIRSTTQHPVSCGWGRFRCEDGSCIDSLLKCDGVSHCKDGSDERYCFKTSTVYPAGICGWDQFRCNDGECIDAYEVCDGVQHCKDGKDEKNCIRSTTQHPVSCGWGRFRCEDGSCIDSLLKCDGVSHCKDGSDERYCFKTSTVYPGLCNWNQYRCNNGECIELKQKCDRIKQCSDGSDEQYCKIIAHVPAGTCSWHHFQCDNGQCIESYLKCDRIWQCQDGSDEQYCSKRSECENHGFLCEDKKCLQRELVCDGVYDCPRGEDERNCDDSKKKKKTESPTITKPVRRTTTTTAAPTTTITTKTKFCRANEFDCGNKQCIPQAFLCDVIPDCDNGQDEINCTVIDITLPPPGKKACKSDEFHCGTDQCIRQEYVCDVIPDCENGHDELNCSISTSGPTQTPIKGCSEGFQPCSNGVCVGRSKFCDGVPDCQDKSDELNCTLFHPTANITAKKACFSNQFQCMNGKCIPQHQRCDDWPDCEDNSDEEKCNTLPVGESQSLTQTRNKDKTGICPNGSFYCPNGLCISQTKRCDGWPDCRDLSDELDCPETTTASKKTPPTVQTTAIPKVPTTSDHLTTSSSGKTSPTTLRKPFKVNSSTTSNHTVVLQESEPSTQPFTTIVLRTSSPFVKPTTTLLVSQEKLQTSTQSLVPLIPSTPTLHKTQPTASKFPRISVCGPGYFQCTSGSCIHQVNRCDGWMHCDDNSDEINCYIPQQTSWPTDTGCPSTNFRCGDGTCIDLNDICDGWFDCKDESDEMQCSYKINTKNITEDNGCASDEFRCLTGLCIPLPFRCDTIIDCDDKTDEEGCQQNVVPTVATLPGCKSGEFHCKIGQCIEQAFVCDGLFDCSDASDEKDCPVLGSTISPAATTEMIDINACMKTEYMCQNGKCIHQNYVCDGIPDCPNRQDEINCKVTSTTPAVDKRPSDNCITLNIKECHVLGYTRTYMPNIFGDESYEEANTRFYHSAIPILQQSCSPLALTLLCGIIFPYCDAGISKYTCKHICDEVKRSCGPDSILMDSCDWLIDESNWCFAGLNLTDTGKVCEDGFYQCRNSSICLHPVNLCDGEPICPMADDEPENCSCSSDQFRCDSGQCVMGSRRCNGYKDCRDHSDETHCSAQKCTGTLCTSGQCVASDSVCNGQFDCDDHSDEELCECRFPNRRCNNNLCIDAAKWCNREDNCGDNSDEQMCNCSVSEISCPGGKCIPQKWWCDGSKDCPDGFDEAKCHTTTTTTTTTVGPTATTIPENIYPFKDNCKASEFICTREYRCINRSSVCDMQWDCTDGEDEALCVSLRKSDSSKSLPVLALTLRGKTSMVCANNWSKDWASFVCKYLRHKNVKSVELLDAPENTRSYQQILSETLKYPLQNYIRTASSCDSKKVVHMACNERVCGTNKHHSIQYQKFIIGGDLAHRYTWPWVASVLYLGEPICGATLISDQWLVTAAHCIVTGMWNRTMVPYYFSVVLGEIDLYQGLMNGTRVSVDRIVMPDQMKLVAFHPDPDIALLHLRHPVAPSFHIKPICMPEIPKHDKRSACYLTGWGSSHRLENSKRRYSNYLHEVRMIIRDNTNCAGFRPQPNWEHNLCAGYMESSITGCYGDGGGALMCWEPDNRWTMVGVLSKGRYNCAANSPNVFTKISSMRDWIERSLGWTNESRN